MRPNDLDEFTDLAATACEEMVGPDGNGPNALIMGDDDEEGLLTCAVTPEDADKPDDVMELVKTMFAGKHDYAGMATTTGWSPDEGPTFPCWALVTVRRDEMARLSVIGIGEPGRWKIDIGYAPWFALSTAGSLRGWLDHEYTAFKRVPADDDRLYGRPLSGAPLPPADEKGWI